MLENLKKPIIQKREKQVKKAFSEALTNISPRFQLSDPKGADIIHRLIYPKKSFNVNRERLSLFIEDFRLNPENLFPIWERNPSLRTVEHAISRNFMTICRIESQRPGSAKVLHDDFGITLFGRYDPDSLINQFDMRDDRSLPYGVALVSKDDYNGALYFDNYFALQNNLKGESLIRIVEIGEKTNLVRSLIKLNRRYGPNGRDGHKISFAILSGHGSEKAIQTDSSSTLTVDDLIQFNRWEEIQNFFAEDAVVIIPSCFTGVENGLAEHITKKLQRKTIAPDNECSINNFEVQKVDGKLVFDVNFQGANKKIFTP